MGSVSWGDGILFALVDAQDGSVTSAVAQSCFLTATLTRVPGVGKVWQANWSPM